MKTRRILKSMLLCVGLACSVQGMAQNTGNLPQGMPGVRNPIIQPSNQVTVQQEAGMPNVTRTLRTEGGGFQWYRLKAATGVVGAQDVYGNTIIPLERGYTSIDFKFEGAYTGYFQVKKRHFHGACDLSGREIIPATSDFVIFHTGDGFLLKKGKEFVPVGWKLNNVGVAYSLEEENDSLKAATPVPGLPDLSAGKALLEPTSTGGTPLIMPSAGTPGSADNTAPSRGKRGGKSSRKR